MVAPWLRLCALLHPYLSIHLHLRVWVCLGLREAARQGSTKGVVYMER